jgi:hypothetical protein
VPTTLADWTSAAPTQAVAGCRAREGQSRGPGVAIERHAGGGREGEDRIVVDEAWAERGEELRQGVDRLVGVEADEVGNDVRQGFDPTVGNPAFRRVTQIRLPKDRAGVRDVLAVPLADGGSGPRARPPPIGVTGVTAQRRSRGADPRGLGTARETPPHTRAPVEVEA